MLKKQLYSSTFRNILDKWPGKRTFGVYRFLPLFFVLGAALEFSMINWTVGETNFCKFYSYFTSHKVLCTSKKLFLFLHMKIEHLNESEHKS